MCQIFGYAINKRNTNNLNIRLVSDFTDQLQDISKSKSKSNNNLNQDKDLDIRY